MASVKEASAPLQQKANFQSAQDTEPILLDTTGSWGEGRGDKKTSKL